MALELLPGERIERAIRLKHWEDFAAKVEGPIRHKAKLSSFWYARMREAFEAGFKAGREIAEGLTPEREPIEGQPGGQL